MSLTIRIPEPPDALPRISFAQNQEDILLDRLFHGQVGTYLDIGANHPVIAVRFRRAVEKGARLIVVNPRRIDLVDYADVWIRHLPGSDVALFNGLAKIILDRDWWNPEFVQTRTEVKLDPLEARPELTPVAYCVERQISGGAFENISETLGEPDILDKIGILPAVYFPARVDTTGLEPLRVVAAADAESNRRRQHAAGRGEEDDALRGIQRHSQRREHHPGDRRHVRKQVRPLRLVVGV